MKIDRRFTMPNGPPTSPFVTKDQTDVVKGLMEELAAEAAAAERAAQEPHDDLNSLRGFLVSHNPRSVLSREFATAGSFSYWDKLPAQRRWDYWAYCRNRYIDWKVANDDEFWADMHQGLDEPEPQPPPSPYEDS
jgi:hypothetical protein